VAWKDQTTKFTIVWETVDLDGFLADGQLPLVSQDTHRHQVVLDELVTRPNSSKLDRDGDGIGCE
jgi:hypothetical protein